MAKLSKYADQAKASSKLSQAIKEGELDRPHACELCGKTPNSIKARFYYHVGNIKAARIQERAAIVGHHWNGYDNPLDVWWICFRCNGILKGPEWHNGTATKQQARKHINSK